MFFKKKLTQEFTDDFSAQKLREELPGNIKILARAEATIIQERLKQHIKARNKNGYTHTYIYVSDNIGIIKILNSLHCNVRKCVWNILYEWLTKKGFKVDSSRNGSEFTSITIDWE